MAEALQNLTPKRPRWVKAFLVALAESGNVRRACESAKVSRPTAYDLRNGDADFAAAWQSALDEAADVLEEEARRRATEGVQRLKFYQDKLITIPLLDAEGKPLLDDKQQPLMVPYVEYEKSDTLLIFLMKGANPEKYRDRQQIEHTGPAGGPLQFSWTAAIAEIEAGSTEDPDPSR